MAWVIRNKMERSILTVNSLNFWSDHGLYSYIREAKDFIEGKGFEKYSRSSDERLRSC